MFGWFDTKEVDAFAAHLVSELKARIPAGNEAQPQARKQAARMDKAYVQLFGQAAEFADRHPLNMYTKARLANRFKWALHEGGYAADFIDDMTYRLAAVLGSRERR